MAAPAADARPAALVIGAGSFVAPYLRARLDAAGYAVHAVSRSPPPAGTGNWHTLDVAGGLARLPVLELHAVVHLAPLRLLPALVPELAGRGARRVVGFSSASRPAKALSRDARERRDAAELAVAEAGLARACGRYGLGWTLLRPTMVYDGEADRNVSAIAHVVRRFGFFPLAGGGRGRRQPVHADDVAAACVSILERPAAAGRAYDIGGGLTLTYRQMVEAIFAGLGLPPRLLPVPRWPLRIAVAATARLPRFRHLSPELVRRMDGDLSVDWSAAARDFGFAPRGFAFRCRESPISAGAAPPAR